MRQDAVPEKKFEIVSVVEEPSQMAAAIPAHAACGFAVFFAATLGISLTLLVQACVSNSLLG